MAANYNLLQCHDSLAMYRPVYPICVHVGSDSRSNKNGQDLSVLPIVLYNTGD